VDVLDLGILEADGRPYLILELLEGRDLRKELSRLRLFSVPAAMEIVAQVLRGLSALHRAGIVHRDVKLENLFFCADGRVKILDLGAAEARSSDNARRGLLLGTPRTMAPEHAAGKPVDCRADLYAMGLVLYELICGCGPFDDVETPEALQFAHAERTPAPPSRRSMQPISAEMDAFVLRALAKSPDERFPNAEVMLMELLAQMPRSAWSGHGGIGTECLLDTEPSAGIFSSIGKPEPNRKETPPEPRIKVDRAWSAAISALALAALALGVTVGRLLPSEAFSSLRTSAFVGR
jgi:eukaryotic-like serine/threonine-protein kinase